MDLLLLLNQVTLLVNISAFILILFCIYRLRKELNHFKQRQSVVLEKAKHQADKIIEGAVEKGEEIIEESASLKGKLDAKLDQSLREAEEQNIQRFNKEMAVVGEKTVEEIKSSLSSSEDLVAQKTKELLAKVEGEVEEFKKQKIADIESQVAAKVSELGLKILNRSISIDEHDGLVLESLEKAKREGILKFDAP